MRITTKGGLLYPIIMLCVLTALLISNTVKPGSDAVSHEDVQQNVFMLDMPSDLSSQTTYSILKDKMGFVWVSTRNGIDCYDGEKFEHYHVGETKMRGIRDGMIITLYRDDDGEIWAFTERSIIYRFDKKKNGFIEELSLPKFSIWGSAQAMYRKGDTLFVGATDGVTCYDLSRKEVIRRFCPDDNIRSLEPYKDGQLFFGSQNGVGIIDMNELRGKQTHWVTTSVNHLHYDQEAQRLWVGGVGSGLYLVDPEHPEEQQFVPGTEGLMIQQICSYGNTKLVGIDGAGLWQATLDENNYVASLKLLASDTPDAPHQLKSSSIRSIMADGNDIWIAMFIGGIAHMQPPTSLVQLQNQNTQAMSDRFAQGVNTDAQGNIWVAFEQSIGCFDANGGNPRYYLDHEAHFLTVQPARDGTVWCGGYNSGLYHFNPRTGWQEHIPSVIDQAMNDGIYVIKEDQHGDIWVGGLNFPLTRMHKMPNSTYQKTSFEGVTLVTDMDWLTPDSVVVATTDGIVLIDAKTGQTEHILTDQDKDWVATNYISGIEACNGHEIWGATQGAGIVYIDLNDRQHPQLYNLDHGLPTLELRSLEMFNDSVLCVSTESNGIFAFDCKSHSFMNSLRPSDGLQSTLFLQASSTHAKEGLVFGGDQGAVIVHAADLLTEIRSFDVIALGQGADEGKVFLPYDARNLDIQFTTNDIYHQREYAFYYRIAGLMNEWQTIDNSRHVRFAQLPAGDFKLEVRAVGAVNQTSSLTIDIVAEQEPWMRWYAIVGYILATVLLTIIGMMLLGWEKGGNAGTPIDGRNEGIIHKKE